MDALKSQPRLARLSPAVTLARAVDAHVGPQGLGAVLPLVPHPEGEGLVLQLVVLGERGLAIPLVVPVGPLWSHEWSHYTFGRYGSCDSSNSTHNTSIWKGCLMRFIDFDPSDC